jgi:hypothetical protein
MGAFIKTPKKFIGKYEGARPGRRMLALAARASDTVAHVNALNAGHSIVARA